MDEPDSEKADEFNSVLSSSSVSPFDFPAQNKEKNIRYFFCLVYIPVVFITKDNDGCGIWISP